MHLPRDRRLQAFEAEPLCAELLVPPREELYVGSPVVVLDSDDHHTQSNEGDHGDYDVFVGFDICKDGKQLLERQWLGQVDVKAD